MRGQWIGNYSGTNQGLIIVELDERDDCYFGWAYLFDSRQGYPHSSALIRTPNKEKMQEFDVPVGPIDANPNISPWNHVAKDHPNFSFPKSAKVTVGLDDKSLAIRWVTDIDSTGNALLPKTKAKEPSELVPRIINTWRDFRDYVSDLPTKKYVFRGQMESSVWRLSTLFHRSGRSDLKRLIYQDIPEIYRATINQTSHKFNLGDPDERGAFYALVQHHGFPTPLLDWTYSPFVAAYFAYSELPKKFSSEERRCRIFKFDAEQWKADFAQLVDVVGCQPHFSLINTLALGNPRMVNQQALVALTNVADLESYIRNREQEQGKIYLEAIDLPQSSRAEVIKNLDMMGITAASLFPGIDGVCKYQRERLFAV